MDFVLSILRDSQFLGIIVGSILTAVISLIFYKLEKKDFFEQQKILRKKEIDKSHIDETIVVIEEMLMLLNSNEPGIANPIPKEMLIKLQTAVQLVMCFDEELKSEITEKIYNNCIKYNNTESVKNVSAESYVPSFSENEEEKNIRDELIKNSNYISNKIKQAYYETV